MMASCATDLAMALDPARIMGAIGLTADPWQAKLLRSDSPRLLLNCARQTGKSKVIAALAVHTALYRPPALILLLSPSLRQSQELYRKVASFYSVLAGQAPAEAESTLRLELQNGSRIISLPGNETTIRGYSGVALLVIDEAARVADDLYASVRPMLAVSGGRLAALSTPFGTRGWWYEAWRSAEPWQRYEVPATDCARIPPDFLAEEKRNLGEWWYRQEYFCDFLDAQSSAFRREDIDRAFAQRIETWQL
jgi:hypothetical protein